MTTVHLIELDTYTPGAVAVAVNPGWAVQPWGVPIDAYTYAPASAPVYASDLGYRSRSTDSIGLRVYPGVVLSGLAVDRRVNLDPSRPGVAAAWGSVMLSNADRSLDSLVAVNNSDGRNIKILRGTRTFDDARGIYVDPSYSAFSLAFAGVATPWFLGETALTVPIRDASYWLERPFQASTYGGTGGLDGTANLKGVPIPKTRGGTVGNPVRNVTPVLIDPTNRIYQWTDAAGELVTLYEGGNAGITFQADVSDLYTGSTTAGQYRTNKARGLFQLGSSPARAITADVTGSFPVAGAVSALGSLVRYMLAEDCGLPSDLLDTSLVAGVDATRAGPYGWYWGPDAVVTGDDAIARVMAGTTWVLYPKRNGKLSFMLLADPAIFAPQTDFNPSNVVAVTPQPLPAAVSPPPWRFRIGYQHNHTVQTTDLAGAVTDTRKQTLALVDRQTAAVSDSAVLAAYRRPNDPPPITSAALTSTDPAGAATGLHDLWSVVRRVFDVTVPAAVGVLRELGEAVTLTYPVGGLSGGAKGLIVGEQYRADDGVITFQVLV